MAVKAVVLEDRERLACRTFPRPQVRPDDGLLSVELAGICHTDVDILSGSYDSPLPLIMGHEIVGIIDEVGDLAAHKWNVEIGDRVVVEPMAGCGTCRYCTSGYNRFCDDAIGYGTTTSSAAPPHLFGAYSSLMYLAPGSVVHRLPDGMSAEVGMLCTVAISNGLQWTLARGGAIQGDNVVVQGLGPIGLCCVAAARSTGAQKVIAVGLARDEVGRELATEFGADVVVAADEQDVLAAVTDATGHGLADVVVDTTGSPQALRTSLDLVRKTGTVVSAGITGKEVTTPLPMDVITLKEIRLQGVFSFDSAAVRRAITLAQSGQFPFEKLVTHRFDLQDAATALDAVSDTKRGDRLKVALVPS
jgi:alcohol dehydrogenase